MMVVSFKADVSDMIRQIGELKSNQIPYATAVALTRTGQQVRDGLVQEMRNVFQSPVNYTLNALYMRRATKQLLTARVGIKDQTGGQRSPLHWLATEIEGGARNIKAMELAFTAHGLLPAGWTVVPGAGAKIDGHGNVSSSQINTILSQVKASIASGTRTLRRLRKGELTASPYFVVLPGSPQSMRHAPGIYQRVRKTSMKAIFIFMPGRPNYRSRFNFYGVAERIARQVFPEEFRKAASAAMATAR